LNVFAKLFEECGARRFSKKDGLVTSAAGLPSLTYSLTIRDDQNQLRAARFPAVKSFDTFDFTAIPSLNKPLVLELARCEYIVAHDNVIALGNSGPDSCCSPRDVIGI
jgi:IstB-like ATP binding protein